MATGFWLAYGHLALSGFTEALYDLENFPVQTDQILGWQRPGNESDVIDEAAELVTSLSENVDGYGQPTFKWKLRALTPLMVLYIVVNIFVRRFSAPVTVRTYNRATGAWEVYWATAQRKLFSEGAETAMGGFDNLEITFTKCELQHTSFSSGFSIGFK